MRQLACRSEPAGLILLRCLEPGRLSLPGPAGPCRRPNNIKVAAAWH